MKYFVSIIVLLVAFGCSRKSEKTETILEPEEEKMFKYISGFPEIKDSLGFISSIKQMSDFELNGPQYGEWISAYEKINLNGSENQFFIIEYGYDGSVSASYPWKHLFILDSEGTLVEILESKKFKLIEVFPNQNPFLLVLNSTSKGNGGHEIYKISNDTLENVLGEVSHYSERTYDAHEDLSVNRPNELNISFTDENRDGFNDIVFSGDKLMLSKKTPQGDYYDVEIIDGKRIPFSPENPAKVISLRYVFLYNQETGRFEVK